MELQVGVKAILKGENGKYLLLKRSQEKYPDVKNRWDIVGGRIDVGSPLIDNLKREIKEETGLELIDEPKLIAAQDILRGKDKHVVRLTYLADIKGTPKIDAEHESYEWFTLDELKKVEGLDDYFAEVLNKF